ncbi:unannotated protein [freshwater metagenome]|uniref:Unannotated protein n=1 Tax=freshwater metagenome TaxID=449393 RepID=A0A6J6Z403_9ZZZZ
MAALFTNSVAGVTGTLGFHTTKNGMCPTVGDPKMLTNAPPTGPDFFPKTVLICAALAPTPANPSPTSKPTSLVSLMKCLRLFDVQVVRSATS